MTNRESRITNKIQISKQTLLKDNKGSAIVMVLVAIAFVSIMGSMIMYSTFYNYKMKVVDRQAKDTFYSADLAMDEVRVGLKKMVSEAFSKAYTETMKQYGDNENIDLNEYMTTTYKGNVINLLKSDTDAQKYRISVLQNFLTQPAANKGEAGAYLESSTCEMLPYTDGIRLKDVCLTYTDEEGYVSVIETDFLLPYPNLGLGGTYEFPNIDEYCLIANEKFIINGVPEEKNSIYMKGSVYGGKEGVTIGPRVTMIVQSEEEELENGRKDKFITDGEIILGNMDNGDNSVTPVFVASEDISLWASGIELNGTKPHVENDNNTPMAENNNLMLMGDSYIQDDITINSSGAKVHLGGTYTGFGNTTTKAKNSSSIIINGANASLDMSGLKELNLGGNTYIGTSKLNVADVAEITRKNEDVKMGNAVASKIEQLAYLVPAECVGYDVVNGKAVIGKNPVNVKDESYVQFMENAKQNPENYKEINLNLIDKTVGKPLSNYGASFEKVYFKADQETVWAYYYLKFASTAEASIFFQDYYNAAPEDINKYLENYIKEFDIGTLSSDKMNIVGNMITRAEDGTTKLHPATVGLDSDVNNSKQIELNKKYAECSNQFMSLCKKLTDEYSNLTSKERNASVYENLINTELIAQYKEKGIFSNSYVVFKNNTANAYAILILGEDNPIELTEAIKNALGSEDSQENRQKVHLIVSERPLTVSSNISFNGTIITKYDMTIQNSSATFGVTDQMDNVMTGKISVTYGEEVKEIKALSLFRNSKDSDLLDEEVTGEENTITADKLVVYENWTKK